MFFHMHIRHQKNHRNRNHYEAIKKNSWFFFFHWRVALVSNRLWFSPDLKKSSSSSYSYWRTRMDAPRQVDSGHHGGNVCCITREARSPSIPIANARVVLREKCDNCKVRVPKARLKICENCGIRVCPSCIFLAAHLGFSGAQWTYRGTSCPECAKTAAAYWHKNLSLTLTSPTPSPINEKQILLRVAWIKQSHIHRQTIIKI